MTVLQPRGIRNNNPGNLKYTPADKWQGLDTPPSDGTFFRFKDAVYGIRAMARTLIAYQDKNNCDNITDFITRYSTTDIATYIAFVANYMKITATTVINVHEYDTLRPMIEAQIQIENGDTWDSYYTSDQLDKALVLAGVEPPKKHIMASGQVAGGAIAAVATVASATPSIMDVITQTEVQIQPLVGTAHIFQLLFAGLALLGIGITIYAKWKERKKGIS